MVSAGRLVQDAEPNDSEPQTTQHGAIHYLDTEIPETSSLIKHTEQEPPGRPCCLSPDKHKLVVVHWATAGHDPTTDT